jgi:hypothetical protein
MSLTTLILGKSGTGKSTSLRNFNPDEVALIQVVKKPLPFRSAGWKPLQTDHWEKIIHAMRKTQRKVIVIDDFQYLLANEYMRRTDERGYEKFTDIGRHTWEVLTAAAALPDDVRVYILSHTEETETGQVKMKTIGKMLDEKITLEGLVTICLRTHIDQLANDPANKYQFSTRNNGSDTTKSPLGLFDEAFIPNDLAAVDAAIVGYYDLKLAA